MKLSTSIGLEPKYFYIRLSIVTYLIFHILKNFQSQDFQSESERRRYEAFCNPPGSPDGGDDTNAEMPHGNPRKPDICQVRSVGSNCISGDAKS